MPRRASYAFQITYHEAPFSFVILRRKMTFPPDLGSVTCLNDICQEKAEASEPVGEDGGTGCAFHCADSQLSRRWKGPRTQPSPTVSTGERLSKEPQSPLRPICLPSGGSDTHVNFHDGARTAGGAGSLCELARLADKRRMPPTPGKRNPLSHEHPILVLSGSPLSRAHSPQTPVTIVRKITILRMSLSVGQHLNGTK